MTEDKVQADVAAGTSAPQAPAELPEGALWRRLLATNTAWIFLVLILLVAFFSVLKPNNFPTEFNIRAIATNAAVLLIIAVGETFVIITGGIDLSVGYVLLFSGVTGAQAMNAFGNPTDRGWTSSCSACSSRSPRVLHGGRSMASWWPRRKCPRSSSRSEPSGWPGGWRRF